MKKLSLSVLSIIIVFALLMCSGCEFSDYYGSLVTKQDFSEKAKAPGDYYSFEGVNVEDVVQMFSNAGFEKIKIEGKGDLLIAILHSEGDVIEVSIGGNSKFKKNELFDKDNLVIIRYHSLKAEEQIIGEEPTESITEQYLENTTNEGSLSDCETTTVISQSDETPSKPAFSYTTNDKDTYKNGNSGLYAYKLYKAVEYDVYLILDFNEGYVYYFPYGNGNEICDRFTMIDGDLNTVLLIDLGDNTQGGLCFLYKRQPDRLMFQVGTSEDRFTFTTTSLDSALKKRDSMTIVSRSLLQ